MAEYNDRYIGEVFIDGKSNKLLQEFLTELFNSYNGPGKGFNADMVDDWHLDDIITYVDNGLSDKLSYIRIGNTLFNHISPESFITMLDVIYDGFIQEEQLAPWVEKIRMDEPGVDGTLKYNRLDSTCLDDTYYLSSDIVYDIYTVLDIDKADLAELNERWQQVTQLRDDHDALQEDYNKFKEQFTDVFKKIKIVDNQGNHIETYFLDAQMVNGFRFIPITQAKYDELPEATKKFWRNIYIISDDIPDDYIDPIQMEVFRHVQIIYNRSTQWLEYFDGLQEEPIPILSLEDLWSNANMDNTVKTVLQDDSTLIINSEALRESLKYVHIPKSESEDYPFITRSEATVLASEITSSYGQITREELGSFSKFDISNAFNNRFTSLQNSINQLNNKIDVDVNNKINNLNNSIANTYVTKSTYNSNKSTTDSNINSLRSSVNTVQSTLNAVKKDYERESRHHNAFKILIGRWVNEDGGDGEYSAQLDIGSSSSVGNNGIYVRFLYNNPQKTFDISKIVGYIEFPNGKVYSIGQSYQYDYKINYGYDVTGPDGSILYETAMSGRIGINTPAWAGQRLMVKAVARYYSDGKNNIAGSNEQVTLADRTFPAYALKAINFI